MFKHATATQISHPANDSGVDALADLPPPTTIRWVISRKQQVVTAVQAGRLSVADACARYSISEEEYQSWEAMLGRHGPRGLRVTRLQDYRSRS